MFILAMGVVCRRENGEWVKRPVGGCGLSGQVWRVGQGNCRRRLVCRDKFGEWGKGIVGGVWSVGTSLLRGSKGIVGGCGLSGRKRRVSQRNCRRMWSVGSNMTSGSKELSAACGLSGQVWRVGQRNCRRMWSVGTSMASGSKELSASVVCRVKYGE